MQVEVLSMILSFLAKNFRSLFQEVKLLCVADSKVQEFPKHTRDIPGFPQKVLKASVVYGANGAGKSNVYRA